MAAKRGPDPRPLGLAGVELVPDTAIVKVDGLPRLRAALRRAGVEVTDLKAANAAAAAYVAAAAAPRAPRRTGRLAASVRGNRAVGRATISAGSAAVPYAGPIHWGWPARGIAAQPFISETAVATESTWVEIYRTDIERVVDSVGGRY